MASFVCALPCKAHPEFPRCIGEIAKAAGGAFEPIDLFVHLTMSELDLMEGITFRKVDAFPPAIFYYEAAIASGPGGEKRTV